MDPEQMDDDYFDRFLACSMFGPPVAEVRRAAEYVVALRAKVKSEHDARVAAKRERDEAVQSVEDQRQRIGAWSAQWSSRVATLEAALREWQEAYWATVPYPEWIRLLNAADDLTTTALGEQVAPTEPSEWRRDNLLPPCPACDGTGSEAHPWDDNCPRSADHADRLGWHVSDPAAPQVAPEPERCHTVTVAFEDGWTTVRMTCPFDVADESRPCWPRDDHGEPEPAPQEFCNWKEWFDSSGGAESMREHTLGSWPVESEWDGEAMWFSVRPAPLDAEPERCPTCMSDNPSIHVAGTPQNPDRERCADPWHRPAPLVEGEQG